MSNITLCGHEFITATPVGDHALWMVPLFRSLRSTVEYEPLQKALNTKSLRITELDAGGRVPEVRVVNDGELPVLMLDGATLVGAKQTRVLNLSVLVAAKSTTVIPVSCVEQGRWSSMSREFAEGPTVQFSRARASKMASVSESLAAVGSRRSDQGQVWSDVEAYKMDFGACAPTNSMQDVFGAVETRVDALIKGWVPQPRQVGAVFGSFGQILGLDAFDAPETFEAEFPKILRSCATESLRPNSVSAAGKEADMLEQSAAFLKSVAALDWRVYDGVGLGSDWRQSTPSVLAGALIYREEPIHIAAFPRVTTSRTRSTAERYPMPRLGIGHSWE